MTLVDVPMFDLPPGAVVAPVPPAERETVDRRRARRQMAVMERGRHPLGSKLHPDAAPCGDRNAPGLRCGGCVHRVVQGGTSGRYLKCDAHLITRGPGTDLRAWWPACTSYAPSGTEDSNVESSDTGSSDTGKSDVGSVTR